ncbi:hypothetical protein C0Q70_20357 [Pomacea canaliculata]|uniref:Uncharacterized protein n=1 Tax=Pomacea canaliculata TaxID=400727 RepID=A0A2T7NFB9_POMCA|nr:hypothetical protein C0Q70_20357 [Pomacea canaliculata]
MHVIVHLPLSCMENWMEGMLTDHHIPKLESRCGGCWLSQVRSFMSSKSWSQHLAGERAGRISPKNARLPAGF